MKEDSVPGFYIVIFRSSLILVHKRATYGRRCAHFTEESSVKITGINNVFLITRLETIKIDKSMKMSNQSDASTKSKTSSNSL